MYTLYIVYKYMSVYMYIYHVKLYKDYVQSVHAMDTKKETSMIQPICLFRACRWINIDHHPIYLQAAFFFGIFKAMPSSFVKCNSWELMKSATKPTERITKAQATVETKRKSLALISSEIKNVPPTPPQAPVSQYQP